MPGAEGARRDGWRRESGGRGRRIICAHGPPRRPPRLRARAIPLRHHGRRRRAALHGRRRGRCASGAGAAPAIAGLAYTARGESDSRYDARAASAELESDVLGRPLFELAQGALPEGNGGHSGTAGTSRVARWVRRPSTPSWGLACPASRRGAWRSARRTGLTWCCGSARGRAWPWWDASPTWTRARLAASRYAVLELDPQGDDLPASAAPRGAAPGGRGGDHRQHPGQRHPGGPPGPLPPGGHRRPDRPHHAPLDGALRLRCGRPLWRPGRRPRSGPGRAGRPGGQAHPAYSGHTPGR